MYLEVIGSKDIWHPPPFTAISSPSVGQGVEEAESEDKLLPLHYVTIVKVSTTDGSCSFSLASQPLFFFFFFGKG